MKVYTEFDPVTKRRHCLTEVIPFGEGKLNRIPMVLSSPSRIR